MKRHTCIICKKKRYEVYMTNVFGNSWACSSNVWYRYTGYLCVDHPDIRFVQTILTMKDRLEVLSLKNFV